VSAHIDADGGDLDGDLVASSLCSGELLGSPHDSLDASRQGSERAESVDRVVGQARGDDEHIDVAAGVVIPSRR
jgi:hypothetical protein